MFKNVFIQIKFRHERDESLVFFLYYFLMCQCRICDGRKITEFTVKNRKYHECISCGSIYLDPECIETEENQRKRYEMHHNSLADDGYRSFLEGFINPVLNELLSRTHGSTVEGNNGVTDKVADASEAPYLLSGKILDYGSGPEPALCELMKHYIHEQIYLSGNCEVRGWDPFFAPDTPLYKDGADLVTCLEVAEHFETPLEDMRKLASACCPGGYVAIGTMLLPYEKSGTEYDAEKNRDTFKKWWYRSDSTHVAFYSLEGLKRCAGKSGLQFIKAVSDRAFLFRKEMLS